MLSFITHCDIDMISHSVTTPQNLIKKLLKKIITKINIVFFTINKTFRVFMQCYSSLYVTGYHKVRIKSYLKVDFLMRIEMSIF